MTTQLTAEDRASQLYEYVHGVVSKENEARTVMSHEEMMAYVEARYLELKAMAERIKEELRQRRIDRTVNH